MASVRQLFDCSKLLHTVIQNYRRLGMNAQDRTETGQDWPRLENTDWTLDIHPPHLIGLINYFVQIFSVDSMVKLSTVIYLHLWWSLFFIIFPNLFYNFRPLALFYHGTFTLYLGLCQKNRCSMRRCLERNLDGYGIMKIISTLYDAGNENQHSYLEKSGCHWKKISNLSSYFGCLMWAQQQNDSVMDLGIAASHMWAAPTQRPL